MIPVTFIFPSASDLYIFVDFDIVTQRSRSDKVILKMWITEFFVILSGLHAKKYHSLEESPCQLLEMRENRGYNDSSCEIMFQTLTRFI